ncbi:MAG: hypothetical protein LIV11_05785 [Bacillota bacterium]|nr:hypothetical protein [Bacillota bacterium]
MFIRDSLGNKEKKPKKKKNEKNRYRNQILNFRCTPEERKKIENRQKLMGLTRQDFLIQSCMNQKVVCYGNVKVFDEINKSLKEIVEHICSIDFPENIDEDIIENLKTIVEMSAGLNKE